MKLHPNLHHSLIFFQLLPEHAFKSKNLNLDIHKIALFLLEKL